MTCAFIHSFVVTDVNPGWTEAVPPLAREQSLVAEELEAISSVFPVPFRGRDSDNDSVFINPLWRSRVLREQGHLVHPLSSVSQERPSMDRSEELLGDPPLRGT